MWLLSWSLQQQRIVVVVKVLLLGTLLLQFVFVKDIITTLQLPAVTIIDAFMIPTITPFSSSHHYYYYSQNHQVRQEQQQQQYHLYLHHSNNIFNQRIRRQHSAILLMTPSTATSSDITSKQDGDACNNNSVDNNSYELKNPFLYDTLCDWRSLDPESLAPTKCLIEQTLCTPSTTTTNNKNNGYEQPQLAKDYEYASTILDEWKQTEEMDATEMWNTEWKSIRYWDDDDPLDDNNKNKVPLYGHLIRRKQHSSSNSGSINNNSNSNMNKKKHTVVGILLFHTGAGPHDLFLLWKATQLVNTLSSSRIKKDNYDDEQQQVEVVECVVLIADILSDDSGVQGWSPNREHYNKLIQQVIHTNNVIKTTATTKSKDEDDDDNDDNKESNHQTIISIQRPILQSRIHAAYRVLEHEVHQTVPSEHNTTVSYYNPFVALGWCLGGASILELSKMKVPNMKAMVSYHGVFYDHQVFIDPDIMNDDQNSTDDEPNGVVPQTTTTQEPLSPSERTEVLICTGCDDPFVTDRSLEVALETFQTNRNIVSLLQLTNTKHGFTNPAQEYHPNQIAFGYQPESAAKVWRQTLSLIRRRCQI